MTDNDLPPITITVTPPSPPPVDGPDDQFRDGVLVLSCGCSLMDGRCAKHAAMMSAIRAAWDGDYCETLRELADGYGYVGSMIEMETYDWSGVRDSSTTAIKRMFDAVESKVSS